MVKLQKLKDLGLLDVTQFAVLDDNGEICGGVSIGRIIGQYEEAYVMGLHLEKPGMALKVARQLRAAYPRVEAVLAYHQKYKEYRRFKLPRAS